VSYLGLELSKTGLGFSKNPVSGFLFVLKKKKKKKKSGDCAIVWYGRPLMGKGW
jgi:hypothetical protein